MRNVIKRNVLSVAFVGDQKVGKTSAIRMLCGINYEEKPSATTTIDTSVSLLNFPNGQRKQVIFTEVPLVMLQSLSKEKELNRSFDLICICFEKQLDLKRFLEENGDDLPLNIPKVGVLCKSDLFRGARGDFQNLLAKQYGISQLIECSAAKGDNKDLLKGIYEVIESP